MSREPLEGPEPGSSRQPRLRRARTLALFLVPAALLGELGHQLLERFGTMLAHHLFHILFPVGAALVFAVYVVIDIRRHGRPSFSWRLRPPTAASRRSRTPG